MQNNLFKETSFLRSGIVIKGRSIPCNCAMAFFWDISQYIKLNNIKRTKCLKFTLAPLLSQI